MKIIVEKIKILDLSIKNSPYLIILILFFNCSLLMDFHDFYKINPYIFTFLFLSVLLNLISTKYWYSILFSFGFSILYYLLQFPRQANHANLQLFAEIFVLLLLLYQFISKKNQNLLPSIQLVFKISLICIYFFAGFHKLNSGFFNVDLSCANTIGNQTISNIFGADYKLNSFVIRFLQFSTLLVELIVPFGLLFKRFQKLTILILAFFHAILSWSNYADFSAFAGFLILASTLTLNNKEFSINNSDLKVYIGFVLLSILIEIILIPFYLERATISFYTGSVFSIGFLYFFINYLKKHSFSLIGISKINSLIISFCCVLFFLVWSLKTYFGFGNMANLTMFSNLNTEKNYSNHYLINTKYTKLVDFEEDNVKIIALHDTLKNLRLEGFKLPIVDFKYKTKNWTKHYNNMILNATIVYKNDTLIIKDLKESQFSKSEWYYKYLFFRKIQDDGNTGCFW